MKKIIAYKIFDTRLGEPNHLYPIFVDDLIHPYDINFITIRGDDCGPFTCLSDLDKVKKWFTHMNWHMGTKVYKIVGILSSEKTLYVKNRIKPKDAYAARFHKYDVIDKGISPNLQDLTTYIDEFECLYEIPKSTINPKLQSTVNSKLDASYWS